MNMTTLFDRSKVDAIAARYGTALEVIDSLGADSDTPLYEIPLTFGSEQYGRADVTFDEDSNRWTVDPYFESDAVLTPTLTRSIAKVLETAAMLTDELNVSMVDIETEEVLREMTIDQFMAYAKSIDCNPAALVSVAFSK